jgi:hypothetical protein
MDDLTSLFHLLSYYYYFFDLRNVRINKHGKHLVFVNSLQLKRNINDQIDDVEYISDLLNKALQKRIHKFSRLQHIYPCPTARSDEDEYALSSTTPFLI